MRSYRFGIAVAGALVLGMLALAIARIGEAGSPADFTGTAYTPPQPAAEFALVDHHGREATLRDHRGKAVLLFFGYTHCPDVCPLTLQKLSRVVGTIAADTSDLRILLITVDPARDTPAALAEYVTRFGPFVTGLTGDSLALGALRTEYGAFAGAPAPGHEGMAMEISHTSRVFGVDRSGDLRVLLPMDEPDEVIARDIEVLLRDR